MHVWNVLHAACWKYRMQKLRKNSLSAHHRTTFLAISSQLRHVSTIGEEFVKQHYLLHASLQYAELRPINGWDVLVSLGHLSKFQWVSCLGFVTALLLHQHRSTDINQTLHDVWPSPVLVYYIYIFWGSCPPNRILTAAKFTSRPSLSIYIGSVTARHSSSERQPKFAAWYKEWNYGTFAQCAIYIQQGGHHVGHQSTF